MFRIEFSKILVVIVLLGFSNYTFAQNDTISSLDNLAEISRELDNPLAKRWSLVFQENYTTNEGSKVDGVIPSNSFFFQPALPIPFGKNKVFTARPVFPVVTSSDFKVDPSGNTKSTGFGDIQMAAIFGPGNAKGWVWGAGATFVFPTASKESLGKGKYQAGPALMLFHLSGNWTKGIFFQHWWSYAGDAGRNDVSKTDFQYVLRRNFGTMSLGLGPTISVDWTKKWNDALTIPIGLGVTKMIKIGNTPLKLRFEPQYSLIRPDDYGNVWNVRLQIVPVIKSPFID